MKKEFLNLGKQPIANGFLYGKDIPNEYFYELKVGFDEETKLITHMDYVKPELMFNDTYSYRGSMSKTMVKHFKETSDYLKQVLKTFPFGKSKVKLLEIGSNDGVFLKNWDNKTSIAVEPCYNFALETEKLGYDTYPNFWDKNLSNNLKDEYGTMDLVFAANCMCHIPNLDEAFGAVYNILSENGVFIFEDPSLAQMINNNSYDQIYDEHPHIFSITALENLLYRNNLSIIRVDNLSVHGGSNRIWAQKKQNANLIDNSVKENLDFEKIMGLDNISTFIKFANRVEQSKEDLVELLTRCKSLNKRIVSYGATSKSTTIFNYCGIDNKLIDYVIDVTPEKQGKLTPGSHIPIIDTTMMEIPSLNECAILDTVDVVFLGAWNFAEEIMKKEKTFIERGGKFITHVPIVKFI